MDNTYCSKKQHFWTMHIPKDCSWIWRSILKLRNTALYFLQYKIGNGSRFSLLFDPWWNQTPLDLSNLHHNISFPLNSTVNVVIASGQWNMLVFRRFNELLVFKSGHQYLTSVFDVTD